jgi:hypothetical protein
MKKLTKDQKARLAMYEVVAKALTDAGVEVLGKSKKGLVLDGGLVEVAVVLKKEAVTEYDALVGVEAHEALVKAEKAKKEAEKEAEDA